MGKEGPDSNLEISQPTLAKNDDHKFVIIWPAVAVFVYLHVAAAFGLFAPKTGGTHLIQLIMTCFGAFGISVGAHQYFSHHCFKANQKLKAFLLVIYTSTCLSTVVEYVRFHRLHHKYNDTNADPHNSARGLFFSHIAWFLVEKHPEFKKFGQKIDLKDIFADKLVMFQHKYFWLLGPLAGFVLPISISCYFCGESLITAWNYNCFRFLLVAHMVLATNSISHTFGYRPFDKKISATDSYIMGTITFGGGWHNFHHTFPWDYKTSEMSAYWCNFSLAFVDFFAWLGWATDLKTVSQELVIRKAKKCGDGSKKYDDIKDGTNERPEINSGLWGWDDAAMTPEERNCATILYRSTAK